MPTNYASSDCAAAIVHSSNAQNAGDALKPDRDSYLLYECSAPDKSVHIQLCQDILVDSFSIGNYEMFSSSFRNVKIYGTDRYSYGNTSWTLLGSFNGEDERIEQLFTLKDPHFWASHIRIDFLSYWGSEFYCPINTIAVYGTTMLDQSKNILIPEEDIPECEGHLDKPDPCESKGSPLEQRQCCRPRPEITGSGSSVYEVILKRITALENQNKISDAHIKSMNATNTREALQLHERIGELTERIQAHQQTIALETLLLVLIVGYKLLQILSNFRMSQRMTHSYADTVQISKYPAFLADETIPHSPPLFSPATSAANSPASSPPPEQNESSSGESTSIEKKVDLQLATHRLLAPTLNSGAA